jgi:hypothetical protein
MVLIIESWSLYVNIAVYLRKPVENKGSGLDGPFSR